MTRQRAPESAPRQTGLGSSDRSQVTSVTQMIYDAEIDGRLRSIGCVEVLVLRGELDRAEADTAIAKLAAQADFWYRVLGLAL